MHSSVVIRRGFSPSRHRWSALSSWGKTSLGCRAKNWTRACLTSSRRSTNLSTPHPITFCCVAWWYFFLSINTIFQRCHSKCYSYLLKKGRRFDDDSTLSLFNFIPQKMWDIARIDFAPKILPKFTFLPSSIVPTSLIICSINYDHSMPTLTAQFFKNNWHFYAIAK